MIDIADISRQRPVLIAGPTASGKSALALKIAQHRGGVIVNADALQVFANWRVLTARPDAATEAQVPHHLYGHVAGDQTYSVGQWLRDVSPILAGSERLIIVGGTGLYFRAMTEGLVDIPAIPAEIRQLSAELLSKYGLTALLDDLDDTTRNGLDTQNPMRVQRAWEVMRATGRSLADWQHDTPAPILPLDQTTPILLNADTEWLNGRITARFDAMLEHGALDEARANQRGWSPNLPSAKAIGARELMAYLAGEMTLAEARDSATIATRQYARRQRSWFRARMSGWNQVNRP